MNSYVALLRGINVGGKNKVEMSRLRSAFTSAGCKQTTTYINSGNVLFKHEETTRLTTILEDAFFKEFGFKIAILLRTREQIEALITALPENWTNDSERKSDVLFLRDSVNSSSSYDAIQKNEVDDCFYLNGAICWSVERTNSTKSGLQKILGTSLYENVTIRNVNSVRKIGELFQKM